MLKIVNQNKSWQLLFLQSEMHGSCGGDGGRVACEVKLLELDNILYQGNTEKEGRDNIYIWKEWPQNLRLETVLLIIFKASLYVTNE